MSRLAVTSLVLLIATSAGRAEDLAESQRDPPVVRFTSGGSLDDSIEHAQDDESGLNLAHWQPGDDDYADDGTDSMASDDYVLGSREPSSWIHADYLHWWTKGNQLPALVTTSPAGTPRVSAGVLGAPGTEIISDSTIDDQFRSGLRVNFGHAVSPGSGYQIDATWFSVFDDSRTGDQSFVSSGTPTLARPFLDVQTNTQVAELTAYTDPLNVLIAEGSIDIRSSSELHSGSLLLRSNYRSGSRGELDLVGGYRYFRFREGLLIREHVVARDPGGVLAVGTAFDLTDRFVSENAFHAAEFGFVAKFYHGPVDLEFLAKIALGNLRQTIHIEGETVVTAPPPSGAQSTSPGGLLTQPTNIGQRSENDFAVLPEFGFNLRAPLSDRLTFSAGYSLLLLNHVARTGEQIDTGLNPSQFGGGSLAGPPRPAPQMADSDFWAQGLHFGLIFEH